MIQTAKAFVEQEGIKEHIADFRVISTGTDAAAQLGAIEDFINQGFDAIITIAVSPEGFDRVIRMADRNNVVLVPFDNILDTDAVMMVNEDQFEMGVMSANWIIEQLGTTSGKVLEVRGLPGNSVDRDRHEGFRSIMEADGNGFRDRRDRRQLGRRHVAEGDGGCAGGARPVRRRLHPGRVDRHRARVPRCRPPDGADGRRGRERLQKADRRAIATRA